METTQIIRSIPFELSLFFAPCTKSFCKEVVLNIPELSYATYRSGGRRHGGRHCLVPFSRRPCHLFVAFQLWVRGKVCVWPCPLAVAGRGFGGDGPNLATIYNEGRLLRARVPLQLLAHECVQLQLPCNGTSALSVACPQLKM